MRILLWVFAFLSSLTAITQAQETRQVARTLVTRSMTNLPGNETVKSELELLDYQLAEIVRLQSGIPSRVRSASKAPGQSRGHRRRKALESVFVELDEQLSQILMPAQYQRLQEIASQSFAISSADRTLEVARLLSLGDVRDELEISEPDIRKLRRQAQKERAALDKKSGNCNVDLQTAAAGLADIRAATKAGFPRWRVVDFPGCVPGFEGLFNKLGSRDDH